MPEDKTPTVVVPGQPDLASKPVVTAPPMPAAKPAELVGVEVGVKPAKTNAEGKKGRSVRYDGTSFSISNQFGIFQRGKTRTDLTDEQIAQLGPAFKVDGKPWPGDVDLKKFDELR